MYASYTIYMLWNTNSSCKKWTSWGWEVFILYYVIQFLLSFAHLYLCLCLFFKQTWNWTYLDSQKWCDCPIKKFILKSRTVIIGSMLQNVTANHFDRSRINHSCNLLLYEGNPLWSGKASIIPPHCGIFSHTRMIWCVFLLSYLAQTTLHCCYFYPALYN